MSDYLYFFLTLLLTETEMYVAAFLFSCRFDGRSNFALRVVLSCAGGVALTAIAALICFYMPRPADLWSAGLFVPQTFAAVLSAWFCYGARFRDIALAGSASVAVAHASEQAARTITLSVWSSDGGAYGALIRAGLFAVILAAAVVVFGRIWRGEESDVGKFSVLLFPVTLGVAVALDFAGLIIVDFGVIYATVISVCGIFYGAFMLFAISAFLVSRNSEEELAVIRSLWNEDRKHYEMQKESMEMINIKCHDLRHQIRRLRESGASGSERAMEEIENSVYVYDSMFRTGSEVLDVILCDYSLRCRKSDVLLTCMADGGKIAFMDDLDVYSLFGNMLENALEYEQTIAEKENRFISLTVRSLPGGVSVHAENRYEGDEKAQADIGKTSKADKRNHGFGIKSMKKIVEKYGGRTDIIIADDMFQGDIFIPERAGAGGKE